MPATGTSAVHPLRAIEGGRVDIEGTSFGVGQEALPEVRIGGQRARVVFGSASRLGVIVPTGLDGGRAMVQVAPEHAPAGFVDIAAPFATGLHQVDNPVFDRSGNLFVTYSGSRGQEAPVSIFRVTGAGTREPFASGIVNATSMAIGPDGKLYVSSRFEGVVYRIAPDGTPEQVATDLGVACGIAFDEEGWMYVGDRSGTIFRVRDGRASAFAALPPSVAAFHLAMSPEGELHVTAPTLGTYDSIYKFDRRGQITTIASSLGRPQGITFGPDGKLYVADALAGSSGLHRLEADGSFTAIVAGGALVGVAFGPGGELVVASNETAYRFD